MQAAPFPVSIDEWHSAYAGGLSVREALAGLLERHPLREGDPVWISPPSWPRLEARADELDGLAAGLPDRGALRQRWPLFGVPFAVKDNIDVAGWPTTAACPAFAHEPERSATVVRKLLDAGAVLLGKTNLDQFATGLVGTRSPHGAPASVFDATRVSGGSSSGSAVAVARGMACFALGTDTAGSGRVPAALNQVVGLKPTPGRVSTAGVLPACRSLDCVSVFATTVEDAAAVLALIEGEDDADPWSSPHRGPARLAQPPVVGVPALPRLGTTPGYEAAWARSLERLQAGGARVELLDFSPLHEVARLLYEGPWVAERHAVVQALMERRPEALDPTVAAVIGAATRYSATDTFRAMYRLRELAHDLAGLWQRVDLLLVPSVPGHPTFAEVAADPVGANAALGTYTNFVNLLGWCAAALPAARTPEGLPFGVTAIAPAGADAALAHWAGQWQRSTALPPGLLDRVPQPTSLPGPAAEAELPIAVVGAHLSGLPLNGQLTERGGRLIEATTTAPAYRLYALPDTQPPKPGLLRVAEGGRAIALEVWSLPRSQVGGFLALVPSPLSIGRIELADGRQVHGFLCEPVALQGAQDISIHGGWRPWLASR